MPVSKRKYLLFFVVILIAGVGSAFAIFDSIFDGLFSTRETPVTPTIKHVPDNVLLIALDGLEWEALVPMMKTGRCPSFKRLKETGAYARLRTLVPTKSNMIWTSVITGKSPKKHGIDRWIVKIPGKYDARPIQISDRHVKTLWDIADNYQLSCTVVNWLLAHPSEQVFGNFISNRFHYYATIKDGSYPVDSALEYARYPKHPPNVITGKWVEQLREVTHPKIQKMFQETNRFFRDEIRVSRVAHELYRKYPTKIFAFYLKLQDFLGHTYTQYYHDTGFDVAPVERATLGQLIPRGYKVMDDAISGFCEALTPDTTILIASDHGMKPMLEGVYYFDDRERGMFSLQNGRYYGRYFTTYKFLEALNLIRDEGQKPPRGHINYARCIAYPGAGERWRWEIAISVNVQDREPMGIVKPEMFEQVRDAIVNDLNDIYSEGTPSIKMFDSIVTPPKELKQDDIIAYLNYDIPDETVFVIQGKRYQFKDFLHYEELSGSHNGAPPGVFISNGPGVKEDFYLKKATIYDILPTILYVFDLPTAKDFDGVVMKDALTLKFRHSRTAGMKLTYEDDQSMARASDDSAACDAELIEHLRNMGYIQ